MPCRRSPKSPEARQDEPAARSARGRARAATIGHVGVIGLQPRDPFGRGHHADERDRRRVRVCLHVRDRGAAGAAGREHRVDDQRAAALHRRQLRVVVARLERDLVALHPEVADDGVGVEVGDGVEQAEPGAQHRDRDEPLGEPRALDRLERRLDRERSRWRGPGWPR